MTSHANVTPFSIAVKDDALADLRSRIRRTRWPDEVESAGGHRCLAADTSPQSKNQSVLRATS